MEEEEEEEEEAAGGGIQSKMLRSRHCCDKVIIKISGIISRSFIISWRSPGSSLGRVTMGC